MSNSTTGKNKFSLIIEKEYDEITEPNSKLSIHEKITHLNSLTSKILMSKFSSSFLEFVQTINNKISMLYATCEVCGIEFKSARAKENHIITKHNSARDKAIEKLKYEVELHEMKTGKKSTGDINLDEKVHIMKDEKVHEVKICKKTRGKNKICTLCYFVTINPTQCDLNILTDIVDNITDANYTPDILAYVYEQRSDKKENMGVGGHIHMLVKNTCKASLITRSIYRAICKLDRTHDYINSINCINVVEVKSDTQLKKFINYMKGKKSPDKMPVCAINTEWRKLNCVEQFYNLDTEHKIILEQLGDINFTKSECIIETCDNINTVVIVINGITHRLPVPIV